MACNNLNDLSVLLRNNGDRILDGSCKLSLSTSLLKRVNDSITSLFGSTTSVNIVNDHNDVVENFYSLQYIYDFIQKTLALKILPERNCVETYSVDITLFQSLRLLEIQRLSFGIIRGLKCIREQLKYLNCSRSVNTLQEVLEKCGADGTKASIWSELKEAVFSYNNINKLDESLQLVPSLEVLNLSCNKIEDVQNINCLYNLKYLNLGFNRIQQVPALNSQLCDKIEVLVLCNNFIEDIRELFLLTNLKELDLSNNCLMDHTTLISLTSMTLLRKLYLKGNPLCFHPQHRLRSVRFLHINTTNFEFLLDGVPLNKYELREVGFFHCLNLPFERSSSFNSVTTENTVIRKSVTAKHDNKTSDMGGSLESTSQTDQEVEHTLRQNSQTNLLLQEVLSVIHDNQTMQDSGIVARPLSPSECSIGSAASLASETEMERSIKYCESDIEVLSNPSQSSIEVLGRFIQAGTFIPKSDYLDPEPPVTINTKNET